MCFQPAGNVAMREPCSPPRCARFLLWPVFLIGSALSSLPCPSLVEKFSLCFPTINELSRVSLPPDRLQIPHGSSGAEMARGCGTSDVLGHPSCSPASGTTSTQSRRGCAKGTVGLQALSAELHPWYSSLVPRARLPMPYHASVLLRYRRGLIARLWDHGVRVLLTAAGELWCQLVQQLLPSLPCPLLVQSCHPSMVPVQTWG